MREGDSHIKSDLGEIDRRVDVVGNEGPLTSHKIKHHFTCENQQKHTHTLSHNSSISIKLIKKYTNYQSTKVRKINLLKMFLYVTV